MISESTLDLINREIDGETTPEESARVEALLTSDVEARETYESIRGVVDALALLGQEDPPASLAGEIARELRHRSRQPAEDRSSPLRSDSEGAVGSLFHAPDQPSDLPAVLPFDSGYKTSPHRITKERPMNNRKRIGILGGFATVAAALALFFFNWPPEPKDNQAASGAIGAVQKHREQQISSSDVILGDEATRRVENVVYADFLGDASKLSNLSAQLNAMISARSDFENKELASKNLANRDLANKNLSSRELASRQLASIETALSSHEVSLEQRMLANADEVLADIEALLENRGSTLQGRELASIETELRNLQLASRTLSNRALASRNLSNKELANRDLASKNLSNQELANRDLAHKNLSNQELQSFHEQLASLTRQLENRGLFARLENAQKSLASAEQEMASLEAKTLGSAADNLAMAQQQFEAFSAYQNRMVANSTPYLEAMVLEHQAIENARRQLADFDAFLASEVQMENKALNHQMDQMENVSGNLASEAERLESRALANMESRMESRNLQARALAGMSEMVQSMNRSLSSRQLQSQELQSIQKQLSSMQEMFAAQESQLEQRMLGQMDAELAAIGSYMESRTQLQAQFANRAMGNRNLGSRSLASFENYLSNVDRALDNRGKLQNRQLDNVSRGLASRVNQIESQIKSLAASSNE